MIEYKIIFGIIAITIGIIAYYFYFKDILRGKTKPHAFTWLIWAVITGIVFLAQLKEGGGVGAWVTFTSTVLCTTVFIFALIKGEKTFPITDWITLMGCGLAVLIWYFTKEPLTAVIIVTIIDAVAFIPSFRKAYNKPEEETPLSYTLHSIEFLIAILALETYNLTTTIYPASLVITNAIFAGFIIIRIKQIKK